jgi:hypothetical protein
MALPLGSVGSDSLQSWSMTIIHSGDTLVLVDPDTLGTRLQAAGFEVVEIQKYAQALLDFGLGDHRWELVEMETGE